MAGEVRWVRANLGFDEQTFSISELCSMSDRWIFVSFRVRRICFNVCNESLHARLLSFCGVRGLGARPQHAPGTKSGAACIVRQEGHVDRRRRPREGEEAGSRLQREDLR